MNACRHTHARAHTRPAQAELGSILSTVEEQLDEDDDEEQKEKTALIQSNMGVPGPLEHRVLAD